MITEILNKLDPRDKNGRQLITEAFVLAQKAHEGQKRISGEPFIAHPIAVAEIVSDMKLDSAAVAACFLHDVLEDTKVTDKELEKKFGREVTFLVKGVTKLTKIKYHGRPDIETMQNLQAQSLRKMFFAMAKDIRVILIKLADRYHNMKTIAAQSPAVRKRVSLETLEIYGPIAERLGMGQIKGKLEDAAFPYAYPKEYDWLMKRVKERYNDRQKYLKKIEPIITRKLKMAGLKVIDAHSRAKHYYSLYKKFLRYDKNLDRIYDLVALRIILPTVSDCYEALGIIHKNYRPVPGLIKDYVATPKLNGYRSIHTTVFGEDGKILEIQLRTPEMHEHAENGIAAHWSYGESGKNKLHAADIKEAHWVAELKNWMKHSHRQEFYRSVRTDFFSDRVFVMTPKGEIRDLPEGSTALDFAYAIHTDIGHNAKSAKVNGKLVSLDYPLKNGEVVEIVKGKNLKSSWGRLDLVKTGEAKKKIQALLKQNHSRAETREKQPSAVQPVKPPAGFLSSLAITPIKIRNAPLDRQKIFINGQADILTVSAKCCSPLPGHKIIGYITKHHGVSVHRANCTNLKKFEPAKLISVNWPEKIDFLPVRVWVMLKDKIGMLEEIGRVARRLKISVLEIKNTASLSGIVKVDLALAVKDQAHARQFLQKLESCPDIISTGWAD